MMTFITFVASRQWFTMIYQSELNFLFFLPTYLQTTSKILFKFIPLIYSPAWNHSMAKYIKFKPFIYLFKILLSPG